MNVHAMIVAAAKESVNISKLYSSIFSSLFAVLGALWLLGLAASIFVIVSYWKLFQKAGAPGWAILIPCYRNYILYKISFGNGWYFLLLLIPFVNIVVSILQPFKLAAAFGKDIGYGFGLLFLAPIFNALIAFGDASYTGPST